MVLVDATVWIGYFTGVTNAHTEWLDQHSGSDLIALADLTLCEVLQGFRAASRFDSARKALLHYQILSTGGEALAVASASNYRLIRSKGLTVHSTINCILATFCIEFGHELLHRDRDFDAFERHLGLRVVSPRSSMFQ